MKVDPKSESTVTPASATSVGASSKPQSLGGLNMSNSEISKLDILTLDLKARILTVAHNSQVAKLKSADARDLVEVASAHLVVGINKETTFTNLIAKIGNRVQDKLGMKRDSSIAARFGAFILESFEIHKLFQRVLETNGKNETYYVHADDEQGLTEIWELVEPGKTEFVPNFEPVADWVSGMHENNLPIVRHASRNILGRFNPEDHGAIFHALNKHQNTGWMINQEVFKVYVACFNDKEKGTDGEHFTFSHYDPEEKRAKVKAGKRREADTIRSTARKVGNNVFYHQYNLDFRGRVYPNTHFLHEQSSDNAKGILLMAEAGELGADGIDWLSIHATQSWGEDKIVKDARIMYPWVDGRMDEWISYAEAPFENKGWMQADKCWSFLACCFEFMYLRAWTQAGNSVETFETSLVCYIDGSNNGVQHLAAMSLDETVAPLVNLVPQEKPGDVYMYVADKCWDRVKADYNPELDDLLGTLMQESSIQNEAWANVKAPVTLGTDEEVKESARAWVKAKRKEMAEVNSIWREENREAIASVAPNYWYAVKNPKHQRKVCKRPCMTLGYGGTKYGFKNQVLEDTKSINAHFRAMQFTWARWMGDMIYFTCIGNEALGMEAALPGPAKMLALFETLAERSVDRGEKLSWTVPFTNFPVVQQYKKPETKKVDINYMGTRLCLTIKLMEKQHIKRSKQKTAAAPNIVHSGDAAHLVMTICASPFATATVHDSFGCLPGDMGDLFRIVREQFVKFYEADPLAMLLEEQDAMDLMPERGTLDIREILKSDFAFL